MKTSSTPRSSFMSTASPRMSSSPSLNLDDVNIKTWILNSSLIDNITYYRILVRRGATNVIQETKRRYNDFLEFRDNLLDLFEAMPTCPRCMNIAKAVAAFEFPKKHFFSAKSKVVINYRMQAFRNFISMVVTKVFNPSPKCPTCGGQVITLVLRFLLRHATILPENQIPRDMPRHTITTPSSTRSDATAASFCNFPRSTSAPMSSLRGSITTSTSLSNGPAAYPSSAHRPLVHAASAGALLPSSTHTAAPASKFSSLQRYSVPQEEQEDMYDDFDEDIAKQKKLVRPPATFDSFLHDKDSNRSYSAVSDDFDDLHADGTTSATAGAVEQPEGERTSDSSDDEIEMTGVFTTIK
ncbi:hypothetical protein DYB25_001144 [Aphanomyces astaci]|uniref:PX domain-containing protein n=1 Tax=Aphanomyces astaci TaxID=112090 RepID=A0A397DUJ5_APHAT|nr:hypothetical protein DYB25_001144 [Aphanomyces astaci]RHY68446.1 hypothetical protein DYB38_010095 [Aphanomyces astaci]RHY76312.1 hypothetical protein DYB30_000373 [Aphanomyces astaci]RHZ19460.1 hypothetical protein DYB26_001338 [Aphanomyces astaci]RHZ32139.1 hypothetical protein DYB31_000342 [Aphanomyces astaci]